MKKIKLTELQCYRLCTAIDEARFVLQQIKQKPLKGKARDDMKVLEEAVSGLEAFDARTRLFVD